jgi:GntR family transcriptional regulator
MPAIGASRLVSVCHCLTLPPVHVRALGVRSCTAVRRGLQKSAGGCYRARVGIDPGGELAPYLQLARILRARIESGDLPPGGKLPSILELSASYSVAHTTAHKALRVLVDEGLAVVSRGRGIYVRRE